jgi:hypothetical protein
LDLDNYLNDNLRKNRSRENIRRFGDAPIEYPSVLPVSDLTAAASKIERGADLNVEKSKEEFQDLAPIKTAAMANGIFSKILSNNPKYREAFEKKE